MRGKQRSANGRANCHGQTALSTKVDDEMIGFLDEKASEAGVSRAEYVRLVLDVYRDSTAGELSCGACERSLNLAGAIHE